ncbi:MAG: UDP-3-O-acyl-N-acetylglucosamine deacetylase [Elainellaceae cyanobacterium]
MYAVQQSTVAASIERSGIGLHSGTAARVCILPAEPNDGRYFVRTDLDSSPRIPARVDAVHQTVLSTELAVGEAQVQTVEHLLAALVGMGIDNARIEIDGAEVPLLDGSALGWVEAIARVGAVTQSAQRQFLTITAPVWACQGDAFVAAFPADHPRFTYGIDFDLPAIGNQWFSWSPHQAPFAEAIAPARTFGLAHQIEHLRHRGLIKGGSLDNALVCGADGWLNPPLRFSNEPVRHKLLDLVGDLSLLGALPVAHILAYKASHSLHVQFNQSLANVFLFT